MRAARSLHGAADRVQERRGAASRRSTIWSVDDSVFTRRRWRNRFKSDARVAAEQRAAGRMPDATADEVGAPADNVGWQGQPIRSKAGSGGGSLDPSSPGWVGWAGGFGSS
jgi:hypothetical protein